MKYIAMFFAFWAAVSITGVVLALYVFITHFCMQ